MIFNGLSFSFSLSFTLFLLDIKVYSTLFSLSPLIIFSLFNSIKKFFFRFFRLLFVCLFDSIHIILWYLNRLVDCVPLYWWWTVHPEWNWTKIEREREREEGGQIAQKKKSRVRSTCCCWPHIIIIIIPILIPPSSPFASPFIIINDHPSIHSTSLNITKEHRVYHHHHQQYWPMAIINIKAFPWIMQKTGPYVVLQSRDDDDDKKNPLYSLFILVWCSVSLNWIWIFFLSTQINTITKHAGKKLLWSKKSDVK